jgi:acyl carrier protein
MAKQCSIILTVERPVSAVAGERRYIVQSAANSTEYVPSKKLLTLEEVNELVKSELADIKSTLVDYILSHHPSRFDRETLPPDKSLLDLEVLDSAGVIEFIVFAETRWEIEISDEDITKERMGSLNKMAELVREYTARKK